MVDAHNSDAYLNDVTRREGEVEGGLKGIPTPGADVSTGLLWSVIWDARDMRKY